MSDSKSKERLEQVKGHLVPIKSVAGSSLGKRLEGKVVIITGCDSPLGIGRAAAHQFAQHGVTALYICDAVSTHLNTLADELREAYPDIKVHPLKFDAADEKAVAKVVRDAIATFGRLDVFFANAGIVGAKMEGTPIPAPLHALKPEDFMETQRVNVLSVFLAIKHASQAMEHLGGGKTVPGGTIIATSSVAGIRSGAGGIDYSASKSAVLSLVQTSANTLAGKRIRVNALCPGIIETGMTSIVYEMARAKGTEKKIGQLNPLRRGGHADEVARAALWLASEESSYVNGQAIVVDGGLSSSLPVVQGRNF